MSYNPNEITKLKHFQEFAYQLSQKLVATTPASQRNPRITVGDINYTSGTIRVPLSAIPANNIFYIGIGMQKYLPLISVKPVLIINSPDNSLTFEDSASYGATKLTLSIALKCAEKIPFNFSFSVYIKEGDGFAPYQNSYDVEVYDDSI